VTGQLNQDFHWLIYCDPSTEAIILNRISVAIQNISSYEIIFVTDFKEMLVHLQNKISEAETEFVITTRLDNDDGIGINYIRDVQAHFIPEGNIVLNFLGGVNYNVSKAILTFNHYAINNPFISLIEEKQNAPATVMGFSHLHAMSKMKVKNIRSSYSFWMTLHSRNETSRVNTGWPIFNTGIARYYNIDQKLIRISVSNSLIYLIRWFPNALFKKIKYKSKRAFQFIKHTA